MFLPYKIIEQNFFEQTNFQNLQNIQPEHFSTRNEILDEKHFPPKIHFNKNISTELIHQKNIFSSKIFQENNIAK